MKRNENEKNSEWVLKNTDSSNIKKLSAECNLTDLQVHLLLCRGLDSAEKINNFLNPSFDKLHDPFEFNEMEKAVSLVLEAIRKRELILVHGDFDADGITGTTLIYQFLREAGANVLYFVPRRATDGYGLAMRVMEKGVQNGLKLVISVDCGSSDSEVVSFLLEKGVKVLVTDHHDISVRINADAFINPKFPSEKYPFTELAGVGVAFKLVQALAKSLEIDFLPEKYLDLVALGTLGDYMPLRDENRIFVSLGLDAMTKWARPGLGALRTKSGLDKENFSAKQVCFTIIPRLNSPGRIGSARDVVSLLVENDPEGAFVKAGEIEEKNKQRKYLDKSVTEQAYYLADIFLKRGNPNALVFSSASWHQGVVGIGAARLAERYRLPAALIAVQENGVGKGSVRSAGVVHVRNALEKCSSLLIAFGGHKEAGGFSVHEDKITDFINLFNKVVGELVGDGKSNHIHEVDMEISIEECTMEFLSFLERMAPFGPGNIEPVFMFRGVDVLNECRIVGNGHLKFEGSQNSAWPANFIGFSMGKVWKPQNIYGQKMDILANLQKNYYKGKLGKQFTILDLRLSEEKNNSVL